MKQMPVFWLLAALLLGPLGLKTGFAAQTIDPVALKKWIQSYQDVSSMNATFVQTRKMLAVRNPLKSEGEFWYQKPDLFRWQLGDPPKTIVVHDGSKVTILDTEARKAQIILPSEDDESAGSFLNMAFPRSFSDFVSAFDFLSYEEKDELLTVKVKPKAEKLADEIKSITFVIQTYTNQLLEFSVSMKGGTAIETQFNEVAEDVSLKSGFFDISVDGYEVEQP